MKGMRLPLEVVVVMGGDGGGGGVRVCVRARNGVGSFGRRYRALELGT